MLAAGEKIRIEKWRDVGRRDGTVRDASRNCRNFNHRLVREHPARPVANDLYVEAAARRLGAYRVRDGIRAHRHGAGIPWDEDADRHCDSLPRGEIAEKISSKRLGVTRP